MIRIKRFLSSDRGMQLVNALFLLTVLIRHNGMVFVAYGAWIIYLRHCMNATASPASKTIYKGFVVFASVMILINAYFYVKTILE